MKFVSLKIEHFAGVISSEVEFGPGLNVLYGPNELGKSTTAEAARAALLLQPSSAAHKPWIRWNSDDAPQVELVFQTEEQRFWRVKKTFGVGSKGKATLDESKDGASFSLLSKGRNVDGDIRKLLRWGIPEPGAKGAPKGGLPNTYLTSVLLPRQDEVTGVLGQQLSEDYDESGRQLLTDALQALATDPLFAKVLAESQGRFDRAFTSKGFKKSGKNSPWKKLSDEVAKAQERVQHSRREEEDSDAVRQTIAQLRDELLDATDGRDADRQAFDEMDAYLREVGVLDEKVKKAQAEFDAAQKIHNDYTALLNRQKKLSDEAESLKKKLAAADESVSTTEAGMEAAKEAVRIASSDESESQRRVEQQENEKALLKLEAEERDVKQTQEKAEAVGKFADELQSVLDEAAEAKSALERTQRAVIVAAEELEAIKGLRVWERRQEVLSQLEIAKKKQALVELQTDENADSQRMLASMQKQLASAKIPDRHAIAGMKQLREDLRVAEAGLDVGLMVELKAKQPLDVTSENGADKDEQQVQARSVAKFEADSRLTLTIEGIADIVIQGGKPKARERHQKLSAQWDKDVKPALKAAKVATLEELEAARHEHDDLQQTCDNLVRDIESKQREIELNTGAKDQVDRLQIELDRLASEVTKFDTNAITSESRKLKSVLKSPNPVDAISQLIDERQREHDAQKLSVAKEEERIAGLERKSEDREMAVKLAAEKLTEPWQTVLESSAAKLQEFRQKREMLDAQHRELNRARQTALANAQKKLETAEQKLAAARDTRRNVSAQHAEALEAFNKCCGQVSADAERFQSVDPAVNKVALDECERERKALKPIADATPDRLAELKARLADRQEAVERIQRSIFSEEGKLQVVGGDAARERLEKDMEALRQKQQEEEVEELSHNAWKLLLETLRDVENQESAHLGQSLTGPIAERFGQLTSGRVGGMQLGPALETQAVVVDGEHREIDRMSVGTREQLSTILRLCIAEQLGSVLMLDDQLTQSDPERMEWFRDMFRKSAKTTQIIVMTCRPEDYLLPSEIESGKPAYTNRSGLVRAIDLTQTIQR